MSAALLLTGFAAQDLPAPETYAPTSGGVAATALTHMPDETESWPFAAGKGCFFKGRDGKDFYFLERLFLLLSFPNLAVPGYPGRRVGEAIRWKTAGSLEALGLPSSLAAFEIVDVQLLEAAVYPQYASGMRGCPRLPIAEPNLAPAARERPTLQPRGFAAGTGRTAASTPAISHASTLSLLSLLPLSRSAGSFNKTAAKWGLVSPGSKTSPASRRLSRDCIYLPPSADGLPSVLRPLPAGAGVDEVFSHLVSAIRPVLASSRSGGRSAIAAGAAGAAYTLAAAAAAAATADDEAPTSPEASRTAATLGACGARAAVPDGISQMISAIQSSRVELPEVSDNQLQAMIAISSDGLGRAASSASDTSSSSSTAYMSGGSHSPTNEPPQLPHPPYLQHRTPSTAAEPFAPLTTPIPRLPSDKSLDHSLTSLEAGGSSIAAEGMAPGGCLRASAAAVVTPHAGARGTVSAASTAGGGGRKRSATSSCWAPLQVALWDKQKRQKLPSSSYRGDLHEYLRANPHLEVYNRQDALGAGASGQLLAGTKITTHQPSAGGHGGEPRVVLWDGRQQRKLSIEESPTQAGLCAFLRANPHVQVYTGQMAHSAPSLAQSAPSLPQSSPSMPQQRWAAPKVLGASTANAAGTSVPSSAAGSKMISLSNAKSMAPNRAKPRTAPAALGPANTPPAATASFAKAKPLLPAALAAAAAGSIDSPATLRKPTENGNGVAMLARLAPAPHAI